MKHLVLFLWLISCFPAFAAEGKERALTDEAGRTVRIPASPKRIVSLAPSITEVLFSLGLREEIVGVTKFCDFPKAARSKAKIGGFVNPDIERIVSLKPDLVFAIIDGNREETVQRLIELGFPVYRINPKGFEGVIRTIVRIGEAAGKPDKSKDIIRDMVRKRDHILSLTKPLPRPRVFFQMGCDPLITVGKETLATDLIRLAGGRSISEDESMNYPPYSIETVIFKAPEIILISSMEARDHASLMKMWQKLKSVPAVKRNAIHVIDSNIVDRPTPRIAEGLRELAGMIHPEAFVNR
jgi:iron complex transport system substrate-binding protein